jgi:hypothetical protein
MKFEQTHMIMAITNMKKVKPLVERGKSGLIAAIRRNYRYNRQV